MEKIRVLVADDNKNIAEIIQREILKNEKYEVIGIANDGQEEYDMIFTLCPEIVFTDNQMPKMNGLEVIEKINKSDLVCKPKFVLVTSDSNKILYNQCAELDIISVIPKPISYDRISEILNEIIDIKENPVNQPPKEEKTKKNSLFTELLNKIKGGK